MPSIFCFILFYRITSDPSCSNRTNYIISWNYVWFILLDRTIHYYVIPNSETYLTTYNKKKVWNYHWRISIGNFVPDTFHRVNLTIHFGISYRVYSLLLWNKSPFSQSTIKLKWYLNLPSSATSQSWHLSLKNSSERDNTLLKCQKSGETTKSWSRERGNGMSSEASPSPSSVGERRSLGKPREEKRRRKLSPVVSEAVCTAN